jgi:two-component system sensor histidine kinase KdpD
VLRLLIEEDARDLWPGNTLGVNQSAPTALNTFFSAFLEQAVMVLEQASLREKSIHLEVLQQTEAQRAALFSSVSHDLRTPLATIRAAAGTFLQDESRTEAHDTLALTIEQEVNRLDSWIENVLDMSRLEAGSLRLDKVWYPLDELVQDAVARVQFSAQTREIRVTHPDDLPPAEIDPVQIEQVMVNLLENALRYAPQDTPIEVSIALQEQAFVVSVADRGPGIPAAEREHIFEKFYRVADEKTPGTQVHPQGLGLGLAICQGSVKAHGGQIWVEARAGGGARFCFTLPLTMISKEDIDE